MSASGERPTTAGGRLTCERALAAAAVALGALEVPGLSEAERMLVRAARGEALGRRRVTELRKAIATGGDPLGTAFCALRTSAVRRALGATYTPPGLVGAMVDWAAGEGAPARVVDPGAGSGRFAIAAGRRFPAARIVAVELDPLAALTARAGLATAGLAERAEVRVADYRRFRPPPVEGPTLYLGNPPYVRHHGIAPEWKEWLVATARARGLGASRLAGLHAHFFLATAEQARPGDLGAFVTSAEWLDVNYGALVRELVLDGLGGQAIHVIEPTALPFADAATTAAITCFRVASVPATLRLRRVATAGAALRLEAGRPVRRERLAAAPRWTPLTRPARRPPAGWVPLGELCRVHRGAVTGANAVWLVESGAGLPARLLVPAVTRARELFAAGPALAALDGLRRVVDLPADLDLLAPDERRPIDRFLRAARRRGAHLGYIARTRPAWWAVRMPPPAPILATYMARRPPAFVRNPLGAGHVNVAHGLYPREPLAPEALDRLAGALRAATTLEGGRVYAGGLTKFEPREMERILVPDPGAAP